MEKEKWLVRIDNDYYENVHIVEGTIEEATAFVKKAVEKMIVQRQEDAEEDGAICNVNGPEDIHTTHCVTNGVDSVTAECFVGYEGEFEEPEVWIEARAIKLDTIPVKTFDEIMKSLG